MLHISKNVLPLNIKQQQTMATTAHSPEAIEILKQRNPDGKFHCGRCQDTGIYWNESEGFNAGKVCPNCKVMSTEGKGHQLQSTAREYDSIKSSLELCLRIAVEQKEVRIGDINYVNLISLIEKYDMLATREMDFYNERA